MSAFDWVLCGLAAFLVVRAVDCIQERHRFRRARSAALSDAKKRKSGTRGERPAGGGAPPAPVYIVGVFRPVRLSRVLADEAFADCELTDRMPCYGLPDDEEALAIALRGAEGAADA